MKRSEPPARSRGAPRRSPRDAPPRGAAEGPSARPTVAVRGERTDRTDGGHSPLRGVRGQGVDEAARLLFRKPKGHKTEKNIKRWTQEKRPSFFSRFVFVESSPRKVSLDPFIIWRGATPKGRGLKAEEGRVRETARGERDFRKGPPMIGPNGAERGARSVGGAADGAKGEAALAGNTRGTMCGAALAVSLIGARRKNGTPVNCRRRAALWSAPRRGRLYAADRGAGPPLRRRRLRG